MSTAASKIILALLDLPRTRYSELPSTLVVGDVEREFFDLTDQYQIRVNAIPNSMVYSHNQYVKSVDIAKDVNTYSVRSLFLLDVAYLAASDRRYQLWRVLQEKAKVVLWTDSTTTLPSAEELADIGCDREPAKVSLADADHPGNSLLYFQVRRDSSRFAKARQ